MRYTSLILVALLSFCIAATAQDKFFEMVDKDLSPRVIQLFGTENNELLIHYIQHNKATGYTTKIHKSYLIIPGTLPQRIALPYSLDVKGLGYNNDFYFLIALHREGLYVAPDAKIAMYKVAKLGQSINGMMDLSLEGEDNKFIFSEGGAIYVITSIRKPSKIRIRRIKEFNIEIFDYPIDKDKIFLSSDVSHVPQAQAEITPSPNLKVFLRNGKVMMAIRDRNAVSKGSSLDLYEFSLTSPATFKSRQIVPAKTRGKFEFFPYGERMLLYETNDLSAKIDILDMRTLHVVKSFSTDEPNTPMLKGAPYKCGLLSKYNETMISEGKASKLELIAKYRPWIHAWPVDASHFRISFGSFIPSFQYVYLNIFLDPVSLEISNALPAPSRRQVLLDKIYGERRPTNENISVFCTQDNVYVLEFVSDRGAFTIWK